MAPFREAFEAAATAAFCSITQPIERTVALGENWYGNRQGAPNAGNPTPLGQGLRAARNVLCGEPPDDIGDQFAPPFTGGQCPGELYDVTFVTDFRPEGRTRRLAGPIGFERRVTQNASATGLAFIITYGDGEELSIRATTNYDPEDPITGQITSVVPVDGTDDCGDPPDQGPLYLPPDYETDVTVDYDDPDGTPRQITVPLVFAPVEIENNFDIKVPIRATFDGTANIDAELNLQTGDIKVSVRNSFDGPPIVDDPTIDPDPDGVPGIPDESGETIAEKIIGVFIKVSSVSPSAFPTEKFTTAAGAEFYIPRLAEVSFLVDILSSAGQGWTQDIALKYTEQVIMCPVPWGANAVSVTEQDGVALSVTLIRGRPERDLLLRSAGVE